MEFQRAKRYGLSLSFLILDTDDFKLVNDTYGHDAGDQVLLSIADILRSEIRSFDLVARYGGDEFIIMVVDAEKEDVSSIAERIRELVERTPVAVDSHILNVCLSVGIAIVDAGDTHLGLTLKRGDKALYDAKKQGRNCVVFA